MKKIVVAGVLFALTMFAGNVSYVFADIPTLPVAEGPSGQRDKFSTDLFTGSASYSYPIRVPKGTNDLAPEVTLSYNSLGVGDTTVQVGAGWELNRDYIQRDVNYTPLTTTDDKYKLHLKGATYDLVYNPSDSLFHTSIESHLKIQQFLTGGQNTTGMYWQVTAPDGTVYRFGYNTYSELLCNGQNYDSTWNVDQVTDTHNNHLYYSYYLSNGFAYLTQIQYNNDLQREVDFSYISNPYQHQIYSQGCNLTETQRLSNIQVKASGSLVHEYDLGYTTATSGMPLLQSITEKGSDGSALPPTTFAYNNEPTTWGTQPAIWDTNNGIDAYFSMTSADVRLLDVDGDGLPDIVKAWWNGGYDTYQVYKNLGNTWSNQPTTWLNNANIDAHPSEYWTRLIDVNGDGLPDIVKATADTWYVFKNTGSGWNPNPEIWASGSQVPGFTQTNNMVALIDVNGDGLPDVVQTVSMGAQYWTWNVYKNTGTGFSTTPETWINNQPVDVSLAATNARLVDVNGDGLPDIVHSINTGGPNNDWVVFLNTGSSWNPTPQTWANPIDANLDSGAQTLADVNGDGLADIISVSNYGGANNAWNVYLNTGSSWNSQPVSWVNGGYIDANSEYGDTAVADVNGDGLVDVIRSASLGSPNSEWRVYADNANAPDMLSDVHTEQGGTIHFDYAPSTAYQNTALPFSLWVVKKMTQTNGLTNTQATTSTTAYAYKNGVYNATNHELRGFGEVDVTNPNSSITQNTFAQDDALKGNLLKTYTFDAQNKPYTETDYTWNTLLANSIYIDLLGKMQNYTYDGVASNPKITETDYQYDSYGNQTKISELGDINITGDERYTYNEYAYNPNSWIVNKLAHTYLMSADNSTKISETWDFYDNATPSASPIGGQGNGVSGFGDGHDGDMIISANTTETPIDSSISGTAGSNFAIVSGGLALVPNQIVLLHQTQGTNAGTWELARILSYNGNTVQFTSALTNSYSSTNGNHAQMRVIPQYHNVTVNTGITWSAKPWNGTTGGILAFLYNGTFSGSGSIVADGDGFRGGNGTKTNSGTASGYAGEGTTGTSLQQTTANGNGGGGAQARTGVNNSSSAPGGGGGNSTIGGSGSGGDGSGNWTDGAGGNQAGSSDLTSLNLGGGGGGGATVDLNIHTAGNGGNGGGIVLPWGATYAFTGTISAAGQQGTHSDKYAPGGSGAGGSILIKAQVATLGSNIITALGVAGLTDNGATSGTGSDGRIHVDYLSSNTGITNPAASTSQIASFTLPAAGNPTPGLTKGDLTAEIKWRNTGGANAQTTYTYDSYGNQTAVTDDNNHTTQYVYGLTDTTHTYPERMINAKNQATNYSYSLGTGNVLSKTDPNNFTTTYTYDVFGRPSSEVDPYDSTAFPTVSYQYFDTTSPQGKLVAKRTTAGSAAAFNTYNFTDGFGRTLQTRSDAEDTTKQAVTDIFYDSMGLVSTQTIPHLDTLSTTYATPSSGTKTVTSAYDVLGRLITLTNPDLTQKHISYDHFTKTLTDENQHTTTQVLNAFGKIIEVDENNGNSTPFATYYSYDPKDQLTKITDNAGNNTIYTYDSLGNKITQVDPDMGTWHYTYDGVGNLINQTDNRAITTTRTYDELNRITRLHYPTDADIVYTYDTNTIGTLASKTDHLGTISYVYDQRLRKTQESRTIGTSTWVKGYAYDSSDRLTSQTNPDGEVVTYAYDPQGKVSAVSGVVSNIDYDAQGNMTSKTLANSLTSQYTYDPSSFRLTRIKTGPYQDVSYTYDPTGNVKTMRDNTTNVTQTFTYDYENRLTNAVASDGSYNYAYVYDPLGNLIQFTNNLNLYAYTYGQQAGPHALTSSGDPVAITPTPTPTPTPPATPTFGTGADGALTISTNTTDAPIDSAATGTSGTTTLSATNTAFAAGQEILILQMQGANAGVWERNTIQNYTAGTITTTAPLINTYASSGTNKAQVLVLKQYTNVTVNNGVSYTAKAWNGTTGGILAFLANGTVSINGSVVADGKGYRGGAGSPDNNQNTLAYQGESYTGTGVQSAGANATGAGGGSNNRSGVNDGTGGGGGGYATNGTAGQPNGYGTTSPNGGGAGGSTYGTSDLSSVIFGGGGGGGGRLQSGGSAAPSGGNGGGFVFMQSPQLTVSGAISANGQAGTNNGDGNGGASGGGAGGAILLRGQSVSLGSSLVQATGGTGGPQNGSFGGAGGNGGYGRIRIEYVTLSGGTMTPTASTYQYTSPTATLTVTPASGTGPLLVTADASGSTPGSFPIASYRFNFGDGTTVGPQSSAYASHTYSATGTYTVTVTITDTQGLTATTSQTVTVIAPPVAHLTLTPSSGTIPLGITANASSSTAGTNPIATYTFAFGDGTTAGPQAGSSAAHTYTSVGTYTVTVTVTDTTGLTSTTSQTVNASYVPPTASFSITPTSGTVPVTATANAAASTPGSNPIATYTFNFGDGTTVGPQASSSASHTYTTAGTYTVTVTVTDTVNLTASQSQSVVFSPVLTFTNVSSGTPGQTTATLTWTTNAPGTSQVKYGTTSGNLTSSTTINNTLVTSHSVTLSGLTKSKTYYYKVYSKNAFGTEYSSAQFSFTTSH